MEKIIIAYSKPRLEPGLCGVVKISPEAESVLRRMNRETGVPLSKIASTILERADELVEFVEVYKEG